MDKKFKISASIAGVLLLAATLVFANKIDDGFTKLYASADEVYGHYDPIPAGFGKKGLKEYWISCSSHIPQFVKPDVAADRIIERGTPSIDFLKSLDPNDSRIAPSLVRYIDFENEEKTYPFFDVSKSTNLKNAYIASGVGMNGSKGLVIEANNVSADRGLFFKKDYLDLIFSDPSIKALEFDTKGEVASSNFRHRTGGNNICYQHNANGWGLTTQWQTFSYTRAMYETDAATGAQVIYGTVGGLIYVDNIRPVTHDQQSDNFSGSKKYQTMDALGEISGVGTSQDVFVKNAFSNENELKIWTSSSTGITSLDYSTEIKTEGSRSLHFHKAQGVTLNFGVSTRIINSLDDAGITFDILTTTNVTKANFQKFEAPRTSKNTTGDYDLIANKWTTVTIPKANIRDCDPAYIFSFTGSTGQNEMDVYIDNIRPATPTNPNKIIDFDDVGMFTYDSSYREFAANFKRNDDVNPINVSNLRDTGNAIFWINNPNNAGSFTLDHEIASEGYGSLRIDITDKNKSFYMFINKKINSNYIAVGDSVCFDVYSECDGNITLGKAGTAGRTTGVVCEPNKWTTVKLTKVAEKANEFFRLHESVAGATGSFWIDNVRIEKGEGATEFTEKVRVGYDFEEGSVRITEKSPNKAGEYLLDGVKVFSTSYDSSFTNIELVDAPERNGTALKITKTNNYLALFLTSTFYNAIPNGGTFSFDLYSSIGVNSNDEAKNLTNTKNEKILSYDYGHPMEKWVRYTFSKNANEIGTDGRFLIISGSTAGEFYFDNIEIDGTNVYQDKGTFYTTSGSYIEMDVGVNIPTSTAIFLDDAPIPYFKNDTKLSFNSNLVTNGEHKITFAIKNNDYIKDNYTFAFGKYSGEQILSYVITLNYGSQGYQTFNNFPTNIKKIIHNGNSIPFEKNGSSILIPDSALIECLKTVNGTKQNGTIITQIISGDKNSTVTEFRCAITLSGDSTIKSGYSKTSDDSYELFAYSSTGAGTNRDLNYEEHLLELQRTGLDNVYEQFKSVPVDIPNNYFGDSHCNDNRIYQDIVRCEKLGLGFVLADEYTNVLCSETGSVYGKTIKMGSHEVTFANEDALYDALYNRFSQYSSFDCLKKVVLCDEPRWKNIQAAGEVYKQSRRALDALEREDVEVNINLLPISAGWDDDGLGPKPSSWFDDIQTKKKEAYEDYLDKFLKYSNADYICFDIYPLNTYYFIDDKDNRSNDSGIDKWFNLNMVVISNYCKNKGIELHCVTQSCLLVDRAGGTNDRILSMDDIRWLNNTLMGYGVKEISYFTYYARHNSSEYGLENYGSFMYENETTGVTEKTSVWYDYQTMINEIKSFEPVIQNFDYQGSRYFKNGSYTNQGNGYDFAADFDDTNYNNFGSLSNFSIDNGYALLTSLKDGDGTYMQMVQNTCDPMYDQRLQTATLTFKSNYTYVQIFENGSSRFVNLLNNKLTLKLSSGNAAYVIAF